MRPFFLLCIGLIISCKVFAQKNPISKCKGVNPRVQKHCITDAIQNFVDTNYDIASITPYAKPGVNRIYTRFKIDMTGKIIDIQAKSSSLELELEAIKTLQAFPYLIPKVNTSNSGQEEVFDNTYTLPIVFEVKAMEINLSPQNTITDND